MTDKYHINIEYGDHSHARWNYEKEEIIKEYLIPFINGQVVLLSRAEGATLVNMKAVTSLVVYKTLHELQPTEHSFVPKELADPSTFSGFSCTQELIDEVRGKKMKHQARSLLQKALAIPEKKVFVIMKFRDKQLDSAYEGVIKPTIESFGLACVRIDEVQSSGMITNEVLDEIATSMYVLSDLTGSRPNCYYETGFSHALGKELILTARSDEAISFDLAGYRFIKWETEQELRQELKKRFLSLSKYKK